MLKFETELDKAKDISGWVGVSEIQALAIASKAEAEAAGYRPYRSVKHAIRFLPVATTFDRGLPELSNRAYVSVWAINTSESMSRVGFYLSDMIHYTCSHCGMRVKVGEGSIAEAEKHHAAVIESEKKSVKHSRKSPKAS
jgi:hypothetical protein